MSEEKPQEIQTMSMKKFRKLGFLQELNRQFLHPMGLAIGFNCDYDEEKDEWIPNGGITIQDYREDKEGIRFASGLLDKEKAESVEELQEKKHEERKEELGYVVQPVGEE